VIEEQIDIIILGIDGDPLLPCDKREISTKFEDETLQIPKDGILQVFFLRTYRTTREILRSMGS